MIDFSDCWREGYHVVTPGRDIGVHEATGGFEMRCDPKRIDTGDSIAFVLENVSDERLRTGPESKFAFQRDLTPDRSDSTWVDVFYRSDRSRHRLVLGIHSPGEIYRWKFTLALDGQLQPDGYGCSGYVCPPMTSGTYRFVYFGTNEVLPAYPGVEFEVA